MKKQNLKLSEKAVLVNMHMEVSDAIIEKHAEDILPLTEKMFYNYLALSAYWDGKYRILPSGNISKLVNIYEDCIPKIKDVNPEIYINFDFIPVPDNTQFLKITVDYKSTKAIQNSFKKMFTKRRDASVHDLRRMITDVLKGVVRELKKPNLKSRISLHPVDMLIDNIPTLNLFEDKKIKKLIQDVKKTFAGITDVDIMKSKTKRNNLLDKVNDILNNIDDETEE